MRIRLETPNPEGLGYLLAVPSPNFLEYEEQRPVFEPPTGAVVLSQFWNIPEFQLPSNTTVRL